MKLLASQRDYFHKDQIEQCIKFIVCITICLPPALNDIFEMTVA